MTTVQGRLTAEPWATSMLGIIGAAIKGATGRETRYTICQWSLQYVSGLLVLTK